MKIIREPGMKSGFVLQYPLDAIPELTHINEVVCLPDYKLGEHSHEGHEFHYIQTGEFLWKMGRRHYRQKAGELFIIPPGIKHRLDKGPADRGDIHAFALGVDIRQWKPERKSLLDKLGLLELAPIHGAYDYEPLMRLIFRYCLRHGPGVDRVVRACLDLFLLQLEEQPPDGGHTPATSGVFSYPVEKVLHYMEGNLDRKLSLEEMSRVAQLAPTYFLHRFRAEVGTPPVTHHLHLRLNAAKEALKSPGADLTDIALGHGFGSLQHFHTRFRKNFGAPPGRWRAANRL